MDITVTFLGPGLASLPGCPGLSNPHPVVSLHSTTGYTLGCLRHLSLKTEMKVEASTEDLIAIKC